MRTHIEFRTSEPLFVLLGNKNTFGNMGIIEHLGKVDDEAGMYIETFDLITEDEWHTPSLLNTLSDEMRYWGDYKQVNAVSDLQTLIETTISKYTSDDMSIYMKWDDFDDYIALLLIAGETIKEGAVSQSNLHNFNSSFDEEYEV